MMRDKARKAPEPVRSQNFASLPSQSQQLYHSILTLADCIERYKNPIDINKVLDTIDLSSIYENVEKREKESTNADLQYDDFVVLELLHYFKNNFFKWVNKPECPTCGTDDEVTGTGTRAFSGSYNPDQITRVEVYKCTTCNSQIEFPRINNPSSLLKTRKGRCGEWVNCFMLILQALIAEDKDRIRYVWNHEDHVWCEYYSFGLKRWIHLDPCEAVFDEPLLYCNNWGKKMSFVVGFNNNYIVDLSDKYITKEKQIDKSTIVSNVANVAKFIQVINYKKLLNYYSTLVEIETEQDKLLKVYNEVLLKMNQEKLQLETKEKITPPSTSQDIPKGRQTGSSEWTKQRGEDGN
ncbi:uncharacterized protein RJT20DRAFT_145103 [Scheffersomyces xylosifermentans]|uniref:uncharacterized protein n=1 Tax=Scheffersomyces xylosifermentans TaxID=1304137 RepID=UPI00315CBCC9